VAATPPHTPDDGGTAIAHVPALDGLRGVAILSVVLLHFGVLAGFPGPRDALFGRWVQRVLYTGWAGVDLFFVLSGYLITSILLASRGEPRYYRLFLGRRFLRIFPLHYLALMLGLWVLPVVWPERAPGLLGDAPRHQAWLWLYATNLGMAFGAVGSLGVFAQFWTLAIEEQFYLVWPWVVRRGSSRRLATVAGILVVGGLALRVIWWRSGAAWDGAYRFTLCRVDALALGALVAIALREPAWRPRIERLGPPSLAGGALVLLGMFLAIDPFHPSHPLVLTLGHSALAWISAAVIVVVQSPAGEGGLLRRGLEARWLGRWGHYAYGIYVWHWPLRELVLPEYQALPPPSGSGSALLRATVFVAVGLAASYGVAWLSFHAFERRALRLKRWFAYAGATEGQPAAPTESVPGDDAPPSEASGVAVDAPTTAS
jgi:peptidoglycan/LPS O-acetylase OafA/YrhL